jgi:hypothetical protein
MFHLIDKGKGAEASYNMSRKHSWTPKLVFQFYNMAMNNAYKTYKALVMEEEDANHICLSMVDAIKELAYALCQRGEIIRMRAPSHPLYQRDVARVHGFETGKRISSDAKWTHETIAEGQHVVKSCKSALTNLQKREVRCMHQSISYARRG